MLPQGIFSVAVSTVLFPTLARFAARGALDDLRATMANGMRQIVLLLTPAAAAILVLSEPMIRLVYQRGEFDRRRRPTWSRRRSSGSRSRCRSTASSCCSPGPSSASSGPGCRPRSRRPTWRSRPLFSLLLYAPFGVGGIVAATAIATAASVVAQACGAAPRARPARARPVRVDGGRGCCSPPRPSPRSSFGVWDVLDQALGRGLAGQIVSLGVALLVGAAVYAVAVTCCGSPRRAQIWNLVPIGRR